jgi:hypothetical protein
LVSLALIDPRGGTQVSERHAAVRACDPEPHDRFFPGDSFRSDAKFDRNALIGKDLLRGNVSKVGSEY